MKKQSIVLLASILLILLFVGAAYLYKRQQVKHFNFLAQENAPTFVREHSPTLGSNNARVYLVKFSDPACETYSAFHPFVKKLMADNHGKIKLVLRYAPFHKGSDEMIKILEAAKRQGKFWETLDLMYTTQRHWASHHNPRPQLIWQFLPKVGLDLDKVKADMQNPEIEKIIQQELADIQTLNVRKTPGFFVNGRPLINFGSEQLRQLVEAEIKKRYE